MLGQSEMGETLGYMVVERSGNNGQGLNLNSRNINC